MEALLSQLPSSSLSLSSLLMRQVTPTPIYLVFVFIYFLLFPNFLPLLQQFHSSQTRKTPSMNALATSFILFLSLTATTHFCFAARPPADSSSPQLKASAAKGKPPTDPGSGFFGPGGGFGIPDFGNGWGNYGGGYGAGYGGPSGGYSKGGTIRPTVVCKEKGPCYNKKLTCPAKCFTSYSRSGKNYGAGGGGGGCTMDCKKKCTAYC